MTEVEMPDGSVLEFPPGMPDASIKAIIEKQNQAAISTAAAGRVQQMGPFRKALYGAERSFDDAATGLQQITPKMLGGGMSPQEERELAIRREMERQIPSSGYSRFGGDIAMMAAPSTAAVRAGALIPKLGAAGQYVGAAAAGALGGALKPVLGEEDRGENAGQGAVFGAAGQGVGNVIGRGIEGIVAKAPGLAKLPQKVRDMLTLGQSADRSTLSGRIAGATEEKLQSVPFAGSVIANARDRGVNSWRDNLLDEVTPSGSAPQGETTRDTVAGIYGEFKNRYKAALAGHQVPPSQMFETLVSKITNNPRSGLTSQQQAEVRDQAMRYYNSMFYGAGQTGPAGTGVVMQGGQRGAAQFADAETAKNFEAFLTSQASQYRKSNAPNASSMAQMFDDLERAWSVSYRRNLPSSARLATRDLDQQYAPFKTVERAASSIGNDGGDFTPNQLLNAVKARTGTSRFARGEGILQDDAQNAKLLLGNHVPNSGTVDRASTLAALTGAVLDPVRTAATFAGAAGLTSTKAGRNLMLGDTRMQKLLQRMRANEALRNTGALGGISFMDVANGDAPE